MEESTTTKTMTGSQALIEALLEEGVDTVFGYPGGAIMPFYDDLYLNEDRIKHYLVRHEQGAAHAAQSYAQVTRKPGVCIATSGPGATNLITGIANAQIDSVPMICITGQVTSALLGTDGFQETDVMGISMPITKWSCQITDPKDIPLAVAKAFYIAVTGRPGVVVIDITKDAQMKMMEYQYKKVTKIRSYFPYPKFTTQEIEKAAKMINSAKKPFLIIGHGVLIAKAEKEILNFVEKTGIPLASTLLGLSAFPADHELYTGMLGMHGNYAPNIKTNECDLLIAIGMRFDDRVTGDLSRYAKQAKIIHIDIDTAELNKNVKVDLPINADLKSALTRLLPRIEEKKHTKWVQEFKDLEQIEYDKVIKKDCFPKEGKIKMGEVVNVISEKTKGDAIIATDVGQNQMVGARYYKYINPNSLITSGGLGTMGFGMPAGMGAKVGSPNKQVIAIMGDGGFQMTLQELGTISTYNIKLKMVVVNNNFLGMVRQWQEMFFDSRYASTNMTSPDITILAQAYGIKGKSISERADLDAAIEEMLNHDGPYLLEVKVAKEGNIYPMIAPGSSVSDIRLE